MTLLDKRFFVIYTGCLMALDVNAQVLVVTKEIMAQCFFNEPASAFERCCREKAAAPDNAVKTIISSIVNPAVPGSRACGVGTKFNSRTNKCEKVGRQINCDAGQYLPANAMSCTSCRSRYYLCVGGMYAPATHDQGMTKCPYGQVADYDTKKCVDENTYNAENSTGSSQKNLTQVTYNTDVKDYRNVNLDIITEKQACEYWKGEWKNESCVLPHGSGKGRFVTKWYVGKKKFECYNPVERYELKIDESATKENADAYRKDIKNNPWKYNNAQWDPVIEECASQSERDCRDEGNAWSYETGICYRASINKEQCESVGAVFRENDNGSQSCDCVTPDQEFHWKSTDHDCSYKKKNSSGNFAQGTAGWVSGSQYATVESCIADLQKDNFFQGQTKLNCDKYSNSGKDFIEAKELATLFKNKVEESRNSTSEAKNACEYECNGHEKCYFNESEGVCGFRNSSSKTNFMSDAVAEWNKETNKFVCKVNEYIENATKLKEYDWHWNREIGACSYTYNGEEYLSFVTYNSLWKSVIKGDSKKYPWPHNNTYDHSKDKQYCESLGTGCKYTFVYTGIPKCECKKDDRKMTWVYGQRRCEYCETKNGKEDCQNDFSSENTHFLEQCVDVLGLQYKKNMKF